MAALDTFEWFVKSLGTHAEPSAREYIRAERENLFSLRSEDERQRAVDEAINHLKRLAASGKKE